MATLTITTTSAEDSRIVAAFGAALGLGRNAAGAEVKAAIVAYIKNTVRDQERIAAMNAQQASATDIAPT
jgi:hypothetical protein